MAKHSNSIPLDKLEKAVSRLPLIERETLFLSAGEGLTIEQIAARFGRTTAEVEHDLSNALCKVDRWLKRQEQRWWKFW